MVTHITDSIQEWIEHVSLIFVDRSEGPANVVIELGGLVCKEKIVCWVVVFLIYATFCCLLFPLSDCG